MGGMAGDVTGDFGSTVASVVLGLIPFILLSFGGKKGELSRLLPVNLALIYYHRGWKIATLPGNLIK